MIRKNALYFTGNARATQAELDEAAKLDIDRLRNARYIDATKPLEKADFVAGLAAVVERYRKESPSTKVLSLKPVESKPSK